MAKKKNLGGRPPKYDGQRKNNITISLSALGIEGLDSMAENLGLSRSELIERIGRGVYPISVSVDAADTLTIAQEEAETLGEQLAS